MALFLVLVDDVQSLLLPTFCRPVLFILSSALPLCFAPPSYFYRASRLLPLSLSLSLSLSVSLSLCIFAVPKTILLIHTVRDTILWHC